MRSSNRPAVVPEGRCGDAGRCFRTLCVAALLTSSLSSCHKRQVQVPAAPLPAAKTESPPPPQTQPLPPPPAITPTTQSPQPESVIPTPALAPPPAPTQPPRRTSQRPATPAPAQPATPAPAQPATPAPATAPQLGIVLTPEQQRQYNADIDQSIQRAEGNLRSIANRQLTSDQQASTEEVRNFVRQAQAARASDLPAAKRLAERADVLAANLANSFR